MRQAAAMMQKKKRIHLQSGLGLRLLLLSEELNIN
jgi:hypothetical protein